MQFNNLTDLHSENINEISTALSKLQSQINHAEKDGNNPHFKSSFASLNSHWEACRELLGKNGLCVTQLVSIVDQKRILVTILSHSSGQWFKSYYPLIPSKDDPQAMGSCVTYARRYMLSAIIGTTAADDDGEGAMDRSQLPAKPKEKARSKTDPVLVSAEEAQVIQGFLDQCSDTVKTNFLSFLKQSFGTASCLSIPKDKYENLLNLMKKRATE